MHRHVLLLLIPASLLVNMTRADDDAAARTVIDEAICAHGGEAAITKHPVLIVKTEGIFHGYEKTPVFFFKGESINFGPDRYRATLDGELNKQKFRVVNALDGQQGWVHLAGNGKQDTTDATTAQLAEFKSRAHERWVSTLVPLKGTEYGLTVVGEEKISDEPAVAVRVSRAGQRDVTLCFDKKTHLLVKTEMRATAGTGKEGKVETILRQHKEFHGVQRPTMWSVYHDGRSLISHWVKDYQVAETPAEGVFGKP